MLSEKVQNWLHIAGIFGVIISLIFVGIELRQSQAIALSDAYHARAELSIALRMAPFQSTTLLSALTKRIENSSDTLTPEEIQAYDYYLKGRQFSHQFRSQVLCLGCRTRAAPSGENHGTWPRCPHASTSRD